MIIHDNKLFYLSNNEWVKESNKNKFKNSQSLIRYPDFIKFEGEYPYTFKFATVGDEKVGKSSLSIKLCDGIYQKRYYYHYYSDFRII